MKKIILTLAVLTLTACENPSDTSTSTTTTPAPSQPDQTVPVTTPVVSITPVTTPSTPAVTPTPSPVVTPSPAPSPSPAPAPTPTPAPSVPNNAVKTSSFGGYTCALMSTGYIWCSDGTNAVTTPQGNFVDVVVGQGAVCALQRQQTPIVTQLPQNCSYLSDASCTRPSTYYGTYCWSGNAQGPVAMRTQAQTYAQVQASGLSTWMTGPTSIDRDPTSNKACINQGVYDLHSNPQSRLTQTITLCGSTVTANGYLQ